MDYTISIDEKASAPQQSSFFGADTTLQGLTPNPSGLPAHLILTLKTIDPEVAALNLSIGPIIRLVHPFYFSQGQRFTYHHIGPNKIEFVNFSGEADGTWPSDNFPAAFPTHAVEFSPTTNQEEKLRRVFDDLFGAQLPLCTGA